MPLLTVFSRYRKARRNARIVRKLRRLRRDISPAGYTLGSFDRHRCIFVHIPKCAGVSVSQGLFGNRGAGHYPVTTLRQVFGPALFDSYFKFAFVRNPWDRLLSAYEFLRCGGFHAGDARWAQQNLAQYRDFGEFVRRWVTPANVTSWIHFQPQTDFLCLPDGRTGVDFIGRYENLEADFQRVCERLGISASLPSLNTGPDRDYREAYDSETRGIVDAVYRQDIVGLDYCFGRGSPKPVPDRSEKQGEQHHPQHQAVDHER
jgi:Sulfotransferase family